MLSGRNLLGRCTRHALSRVCGENMDAGGTARRRTGQRKVLLIREPSQGTGIIAVGLVCLGRQPGGS